jgi:hypothetical protein
MGREFLKTCKSIIQRDNEETLASTGKMPERKGKLSTKEEFLDL